MSEPRPVRFWLGLALFQVAFGLTVFGLTRGYYLDRHEPGANLDRLIGESAAGPDALQTAISSLPAGPPDAALQSPDEIGRRADEYFAAHEYRQAAELYERLVETDPTNVPLRNNLAITLHYIGRSAEAVEHLNAGLEIDPGHQRSWLTLGFIDSQLGETESAREALDKAYALDPASDVAQSAAKMLADLGFPVPGG